MTFKFWEDAEISSPPPPLHSTLKLEADIAWIRSYIDNPWIEQGIIGTLHIEICKKLVRKHFRKIKNQHMNSSLVKELRIFSILNALILSFASYLVHCGVMHLTNSVLRDCYSEPCVKLTSLHWLSSFVRRTSHQMWSSTIRAEGRYYLWFSIINC